MKEAGDGLPWGESQQTVLILICLSDELSPQGRGLDLMTLQSSLQPHYCKNTENNLN